MTIGMLDTDGLHLADTPLVPITSAIRHVGDLYKGAWRHGLIQLWLSDARMPTTGLPEALTRWERTRRPPGRMRRPRPATASPRGDAGGRPATLHRGRVGRTSAAGVRHGLPARTGRVSLLAAALPTGGGGPVSARTTATTTAVVRPAVPVPRDGWVQVANAFIDAAPLDNERLAHITLMSYAWDEEACHPYQGELAARLGVSVRTIKRRVGELRAAALVTVERGGGQDHSNVYHLHVRPVRDDDEGAVRFATILHRVLDDATLSQGARRTYIVLCRRASGNGWCPCSHNTLGERIGARPRAVYNYVRELEEAGHLRITERQGRSNRYSVETPERRKRSAGHGTTPLAVVPSPLPETAAADGRWRAIYRELMRAEPTRQVVRGVWTLRADVGEATVLEAIRGGAEWCARAHRRTLTIGTIRTEVGKIRGAEGLPTPSAWATVATETVEIAPPSLDMEPAWRDTLNELRGEMTPENYKRWLESTTVAGLDGGVLRVGVPDGFDQQWLDKRLRGAIERALGRVAPGVRVAFEVQGGEIAANSSGEEHPPPPSAAPMAPARASPAAPAPLTVERRRHCHALPCRCPRKERRAREHGAAGKARLRVGPA